MVSVVVRCVGREKLFSGVLDSLIQQSVSPSEIVVVMDSASDDETEFVRSCLAEYPDCRLVTLRHQDFSHPYSTNLGIASTRDELVCITNGHSLPTSLCWLEIGLAHFDKEEVAGVSGFSLPSTKGPMAKLFYLIEGPMKGINWISTINCIIRRSRWKEYPFNEDLSDLVPETKRYGGEDYDWTMEMLCRGYKIVLDPNFSVVHFHEKNIALEILRNLRNYFPHKKLREKIKRLERPIAQALTRTSPAEHSTMRD